ncbi:helix-turn-helix domain-containing protein [Streptomyces roseolus]|uniref:helix-turn-helix domain-containing protein n=1 Tax=Streptomyces roseolus TaxID=67358 RepID=UPI003659E335
MAERDMYQTTDPVPRLVERGVHLPREQVFRLDTQPPRRLSLDTQAALCGILDCSPADLSTMREVRRQVAQPAASGEADGLGVAPPARRVRVRRACDPPQRHAA